MVSVVQSVNGSDWKTTENQRKNTNVGFIHERMDASLFFLLCTDASVVYGWSGEFVIFSELALVF